MGVQPRSAESYLGVLTTTPDFGALFVQFLCSVLWRHATLLTRIYKDRSLEFKHGNQINMWDYSYVPLLIVRMV